MPERRLEKPPNLQRRAKVFDKLKSHGFKKMEGDPTGDIYVRMFPLQINLGGAEVTAHFPVRVQVNHASQIIFAGIENTKAVIEGQHRNLPPLSRKQKNEILRFIKEIEAEI